MISEFIIIIPSIKHSFLSLGLDPENLCQVSEGVTSEHFHYHNVYVYVYYVSQQKGCVK